MNCSEAPIDTIPTPLAQTFLRGYLHDPTATLTEFHAEKMSHDGMWANLTRVQSAWDGKSPGSAKWIVKRWQRGGFTENWLGVHQPLEAFGWQAGLLHREAMPPGVIAPFVGAEASPDAQTAWLLMEDIGAELDAFKLPNQWAPAEIRAPAFSPEELFERTTQVLDRLAELHAHWETSERQATLEKCDWLTSARTQMRGMADLFARVFDKTPEHPVPLADWLKANATAFMTRIPPSDLPMWKEAFWNRQPILDAIAPFPRTLLHGDLDSRNIGLRFDGEGDPKLALVDWECLSYGPPAIDVAKLVYHTFAISKASWADPLRDFYFERYAAHGGTRFTRETWKRSFEVALAGHGLSWFPSHAGRNVREEGASLEWVDASIERVTRALKAVRIPAY